MAMCERHTETNFPELWLISSLGVMQRAGCLHDFAVYSDFDSLYQRHDFLNGLLFNCCGDVVVFGGPCGLSTVLRHCVFPWSHEGIAHAREPFPTVRIRRWMVLFYQCSIFLRLVDPRRFRALQLSLAVQRNTLVWIIHALRGRHDFVSKSVVDRPRLTRCAVHGALASLCCPYAECFADGVAGRRRARRCGEDKKRS